MPEAEPVNYEAMLPPQVRAALDELRRAGFRLAGVCKEAGTPAECGGAKMQVAGQTLVLSPVVW